MKQLHYNLSEFGSIYKSTGLFGDSLQECLYIGYLKVQFEEFKNEILLIAKLQHKNLVRVLGYCLEGEKKTLIYECVPNRSRDLVVCRSRLEGLYFNFKKYFKIYLKNPSKNIYSKKFFVYTVIVQRLLYLHEDTLLRIIHRDLKRSMLYQNSPSLDANIHICI
ncbi:unnamed protein product [Coffea canephora]|uniref:DH200=94 genomic scaffold, scaffold_3748 n=1 Tax=Coffea canephora TaxID=49390 RepID=A0A068VLA9_COFCA|nr:unnamed protein product [Coffea canephora]